MGIPDRESWLLREYYPTGHASGWGRTGCLAFLIVGLVLLVIGVIVQILTDSGGEDRAEFPTCEQVLRDPAFHGQGTIQAEILGGTARGCTVEFPGGSPALATLGVDACPQKTLVALAIDRHAWRVDEEQTAALTEHNC